MKQERLLSTQKMNVGLNVIVGKKKEATLIYRIFSDIDILCTNGNYYDLKIHKVYGTIR